MPRSSSAPRRNNSNSVPRSNSAPRRNSSNSVPRSSSAPRRNNSNSVPRSNSAPRRNSSNSVPRSSSAPRRNNSNSVPRSNSAPRRSHSSSVPSSHNSRQVTPSNNGPCNRLAGGSSSAGGYSKAAVGRGKAPGSSLTPETGRRSIALGTSAAAMVATTFRNLVSISISAGHTGFVSTADPSLLGVIPASGTTAIGSCWLTRGHKTGRKTGMPPTKFMLAMTTGITCTTAGIQASRLHSPWWNRYFPAQKG